MTTRIRRSARPFALLAAVLAFGARAETVTYYATDHLGSPVAAMDGDGNVLWRESYTPYGEKRENPSGADDDTGYTGHQNDDVTGLTYTQARYYDPVVGRFMAVDPVGFAAMNPMSFNRYLYVNANPIINVDPDGRYGRREGEFTDDEWNKIASSQSETAEIFEQAAQTYRNGGDSKMQAVAKALEGAAVALRDDGTNGYWAKSGELDGTKFAEVNESGFEVTIDTSKLSFGQNGAPVTPAGKTMMGHEGLHSAGLRDQYLDSDDTKTKAYRFGTDFERLIYQTMKGTDQALKNPDHIIEMVFPK